MIDGLILIVDDDPLLSEAIATALELHGFSTREADNGRAGLAAIEATSPAIVLLDLRMPVLDGEGVLRDLAARGIDLPVVLMSADDEAEKIAKKYGVAAYLKKPIAIPRLMAAIAACGRKSAQDRARRGRRAA